MKKLLILNSVTGRAKTHAERTLRHFSWYDSVPEATEALKAGDRPRFVVVDGQLGASGLGALAAGLGYMVETRGVP